MSSESVLIDIESDFMRSPEKVMRLDRMGSSFPTRLSFMRTLIRRMSRRIGNLRGRFERLIKMDMASVFILLLRQKELTH